MTKNSDLPMKTAQATSRVANDAPGYVTGAALATIVAYYADMPAEITPALTVVLAGLVAFGSEYFSPHERRRR